MAQDSHLDLEAAMIGILALLAAEREERLAKSDPQKTELILAKAGLPIREIARILGKNYQAIQKTIWRAGDSAKKDGGSVESE
jgi:transposase-like protein